MKKKRLTIRKALNVFGDYWLVQNKKKDFLGTFSYDIRWKTMVWSQNDEIIMSTGCLRELTDAMDRRLKRIKK